MSGGQAASRKTKRDTILAAARAVFLQDGYELASMDAIAQRAGVVKQTVYNHFASKQALFRAFIQSRCAELSATLDRAQLDEDDDPEHVLTAVGENILAAMLSRDAMSLNRVVQSEGQRLPQIAEIYYRQGPDAMVDRLAVYLREQTDKGRLSIPDPRMAAEQLVAMLPGHLRIRHLIGLADPPDPEQRRRYVTNAVRLFLDGTRPRE